MKLTDIPGPDVQPSFGSVNDRPMERERVADVQSAFEIAGWKPRTTLSEGLEKTVDWYSKYGNR